MKKKLLFIVMAIFLFFVIIGIGSVFYLKNGLGAVDSNNKEEVLVEVNTYGKALVDKLNDNGLIKNKYSCYIYLKLHGGFSPQAGIYSLNKSMSFKEIMKTISDSHNAVDDSISVVFVEGRRIPYFVSVVNKNFGYSEDEIYAVLSDKEYLKELIDKYWFLTDKILDDKLYYALEGYMYPDTYAFKKDASIKSIIEKLLDGMANKLAESRELIDKHQFDVHGILTLASIVELEGANSNDRNGVAGVFYNRLEKGMSLGSDVTTYYGAKVSMADRDLYPSEIEAENGYNTRPASMAGKLPIGPICGPSIESIKAVLEPDKHTYLYFVADKNGKTYFNYDYQGHVDTVNRLKKEGLWYTYGD